ncbi:MAG: molybdopterin-dependent oxidoreductase [Desulfonatronovibrio sp.]
MPEFSACLLDCPDCCSFIVNPETRSIRGNPDHPFTHGFICSKGKNFFQRLESENRVTRPMLRQKSGFVPISWDQALDMAARHITRLRDNPEKILHIRGYGYRGVLAQASLNFFKALGSSTTYGSLCDEAGIEACVRDFGSLNHNDPLDILNAARIINWGKDFARSSPHTAVLVKRARKSGAGVLTVSPGGHTPAHADETVIIRPGTDRFLAAAVIRMFMDSGKISRDILDRASNSTAFLDYLSSWSVSELLSVCGVSPEKAKLVFDWYDRPGPAASILGWGLQRYVSGGENVRFINALALISGSIGISGGGAYYNIASSRSLADWSARSSRQPGPDRRQLALYNLGREIQESSPEIKFIWIDGHNIVNQAPDSLELAQSIKKPFVVCVDGFFNDTAMRADLVLPPAFMLEKEEILGSCLHNFVNYSARVLEPRGECRSDFDILKDLGQRLDPAITFPEQSACLETGLSLLNISLEQIKSQGFVKAGHPDVAYKDMIFDHSDGLYSFPQSLTPEPDQDPEYPLRLLSLVRGAYMHSQIPESRQTGLPRVYISRNNKHYRLDKNSDLAFLVTPLGRMKVSVNAADEIHPDTVIIRRDGWIKHGQGPNIVTQTRVTDMGHCAAYYSQCCRLEPGNNS